MQRMCACPCRRPLPDHARANQIYYEPDTCRKRRQRLAGATDTPEHFWARHRLIRRPVRGTVVGARSVPQIAA